MAKDEQYRKMIHSSRWLGLRRLELRAHPLCVRCKREGRIRSSTEVHHIRPVEEAITPSAKEQRMFDPYNLMALCHDCHVEVHTEMGRSGKQATIERNRKQVDELNKRFYGEGSVGDNYPGGVF